MNSDGQISRRRPWVTGLKVLCWVVLGIVLSVAGLLIYTVRTLTPERLTPIVEEIANKMLKARVEVGRVDLSIRGSYPFLDLDVWDVAVLSDDMLALSEEEHRNLPSWADTLLTVKHLHGGINPFKLHRDIIDLHNLLIYEPQVNVLVVNETLNNFSIVPTSSDDEDDEDDTSHDYPDIKLNKFQFIKPRTIRYADIVQQIHFQANVAQASLSEVLLSDKAAPSYRVTFDSNISSPLFEIIGQQSLDLALNGVIEWNHRVPYRLNLRDFDFSIYKVSGSLSTSFDFVDDMTVNDFDLHINPIAINDILAAIPEEVAIKQGFPRRLDTDASIGLAFRLLKPYVMGSVLMPYADFSLDVPSCYLHAPGLQLNELASSLVIKLRGGTPNEAVVDVHRFGVEAPHASIDFSGYFSNLFIDPRMKGHLTVDADLHYLPPLVEKAIGALMSGKVAVDTQIDACRSMFDRQNFHKIKVNGDARLHDFYYLAYDTLTMYSVHEAHLRLGANQLPASPTQVDSLLHGSLDVDTAQMLVNGIEVELGGAHLKVGAPARNAQADTTAIIPIDGTLALRSLRAFSITDTLGMSAMDLKGTVRMARFEGDARLPIFYLDLGVKGMSTGTNATRLLIDDGHLKCSLGELPRHKKDPSPSSAKSAASTNSGPHTLLPADSVFLYARNVRTRHHNPYPRVHPVITASDVEKIDWGASHLIRSLLLRWDVAGRFYGRTGSILSASMPQPNSLDNIDIRFDNLTLELRDAQLAMGHSDFNVYGTVSNMKQGFTDTGRNRTLRMDFEVKSHLIDINELCASMSRPTAPAAKKSSGWLDDAELRRFIDVQAKAYQDSVLPLLVPDNLDAQFLVKADEISYSRLKLSDAHATVLISKGAVCVPQCKASTSMGDIDLSALYHAPNPKDMNVAFAMDLRDFNIRNFLHVMPEVDSLMPVMRDLSGLVNARVAATSKVSPAMDLVMRSMRAAIDIDLDSISFNNNLHLNKIEDWLLFGRHHEALIPAIHAQMVILDGELRIFPFVFDFDRYRIGIYGHTGFNLDMHYHVAVLKSPLPFRFGIALNGPFKHLHVGLGGAHFNEKLAVPVPEVGDMHRTISQEIFSAYKTRLHAADFVPITISSFPSAPDVKLASDTISPANLQHLRFLAPAESAASE